MQKGRSHIVIFSRPIRSGKTTELQRYLEGSKNIGGFLTPDVNGKRMLLDISSSKYHEFEVHGEGTDVALVIGKFHFSRQAFDRMKQLMAGRMNYDLYVVDEVGKLEILQNDGLEPELTLFINEHKAGKREGTLLLVIRDSLVDEAVAKYKLDDAQIVSSIENLSGFMVRRT